MNIDANQYISPAKLYHYATLNPDAWQWLVNQMVVHKLFGEGVVTWVDEACHPVFEVCFNKPYEGKSERKFGDKSLNGEIFTQLWLPIKQAEIIEKEIYEEETKELSNKKVKVTYGIPTKSIPKITTKTIIPNLDLDPEKVKCPYCAFSFTKVGLKTHITRMHPKAAKKKHLCKQKEEPVANATNVPTAGEQEQIVENRIFYQCPYCSAHVKNIHFDRHITKVHSGKSIPVNPVLVAPPKMNLKVKNQSKKRKTKRRPNSGWKKFGGGWTTEPIMKTINAGRRHGAIINRKSY